MEGQKESARKTGRTVHGKGDEQVSKENSGRCTFKKIRHPGEKAEQCNEGQAQALWQSIHFPER